VQYLAFSRKNGGKLIVYHTEKDNKRELWITIPKYVPK